MSSTPTFSAAAVAAPHSAAAEAGRNVLVHGGNAIEAMVAMAATIAVVYPHMNSVGGDGFWLIRDPKGRVRYVEACGFAGENATIARYRKLGYDTIPSRGHLAAVTTPGAIDGWRCALELSAALGGRLPLRDLLADAVRHAREGVAVSPSEARTVPNKFDELKEAPGFAQGYLVDGERAKAGHIRKAERLAATLEHLGTAGLRDFYRGDVSREIAADLERIEAPVTRKDMERTEARWREPLSVRLNDVTVWNAPPPTQGLAALVLLGVFERLGVKRGESFEHIHGLVEATKRALAIRDRVVTDFDHLREDPAALLTAMALEREAAMISGSRAGPFPARDATGDTVWMGAIDGSGLAVSYIQSTYWEYGSGCLLPATGVLMQNRGISFSLNENALNALRPGRRPFHTLNPPLAAFDDGRVCVYGSMGGDGQPQFQAQILSRLRFGMAPDIAVDAPRYLLGRTWGEDSASLKLEDRFDPSVVNALRRAGHEVEIANAPYSDTFGHAGMLVRWPKGKIEGAHDPRSDGGALGL